MNIPYRRIYWRMALFIGAALAAFVALGAASLVFVASFELQSYVATRQGTLGQQAADILGRGGRPALEAWLRSEAMPDDVKIYVLDQDSVDILGRPLPRYLQGFIRDSVVGPAETTQTNYRPVRLAPQLVDRNGDAYAFLVLPSQITLWGSPATAIGLTLVALLVVASVAWLIARTFGRPIAELQHTVREIASGHIDARLPARITTRHDELGALASDFNSMADQIAALLAGRQQLMAELSHELRSPLARLQAALALAAHKQRIESADRERIEQEIQRMDGVIGDLLRFSRLGTTPAIQRRLLRLAPLLAALVADEEIEAGARGCRLQLRSTPELAVIGDPELLRSGLENILRNAIRYSPPYAEVEISAGITADNVVISFADRGPGVPADDLARIFEPYYRSSGSTDSGGTGLGLAIARRVFEAHGGSVSAMARHGGGLVVTARIPVAEVMADD